MKIKDLIQTFIKQSKNKKEENKSRTLGIKRFVPSNGAKKVLPPFTHLSGGHGRNLQATRCVLGGKSRVKAVTLFLTPSFRLNSYEAKGGRPY